MKSVAIIDYGMGNLHSIAKAVEHVGGDAVIEVTRDAARIRAADRVIFPGVGAIRHCMEELQHYALLDVIREVAADRPLLGICLGMQAMLEHSEENDGVDCLGLFAGEVKHFPLDMTDGLGRHLKVPHMGWNQVHQVDHPLWQGIPQDSRFYFVHSYYVEPADPADSLGQCRYGLEFTAAIGSGNRVAVQFHPEKSQSEGLKLLRNFLNWNGQR